MSVINLFFLYPQTEAKYAGIVTYISHLYRQLQDSGHKPELLRIGKRDGDPKPYARGMNSRIVCVETARKMIKSDPSLMVGNNWGDTTDLEAIACPDLPLVIHHPAGIRNPKMIAIIKQHQPMVIVIRECMLETNVAERMVYIPHPYVRVFSDIANGQRSTRAASITRIEKTKGIEIVCDAIFNHGADIELYGSVASRRYIALELEDKFPAWETRWKGQHTEAGFGARVLRTAKWAVDLTCWKNDGAGTQYTILEAWDAGAALIVHKNWIGGVFQHGESCYSIETGAELAELITTEPDPKVIARGEQLLAGHADVVAQYMEVLAR